MIDEDVLLASVKEQIALRKLEDKKDDANKGNTEAGQTTIDLSQITELALSFRRIGRINHLEGFEQIVMLKLDNNLIKKIEGLDHLVNLRWLDLSFNQISKIENLDSLPNLTDLTLCNNSITKIEGLPSSRLQILSLGNNQISVTEDLFYLRDFHNLKCLNLKGNPLCQRPEFKVTVYAYLKSLRHLDYERVQESQTRQAREEKQGELLVLEQKEKTVAEAQKSKDDLSARVALLSSANIEIVENLAEDMIKDDADIERLQILPVFDEILAEFREQCSELTKEFITEWMKRFRQKEMERDLFERSRTKVHNEMESSSIAVVEDFQTRLKKTKQNPEMGVDPVDIEKEMTSLMEIEMIQVEQIKQLVDVYEDRIDDICRANVQATESFFAQIGDKETNYFNKTTELVQSELEKLSQTQAPEESDDPMRDPQFPQLINQAANQSHESHTTNAGKCEDEILRREETEKTARIKEIREEEYKRNRRRVAEISALRDLLPSSEENE